MSKAPQPPRFISIAEGFCAIVDGDDFDRLSAIKWYPYYSARCFYASSVAGNLPKSEYHFHLMHHHVIGENVMVDHINRNTFDNRKDNLRVCNTSQNACNQKVRRNSKTGAKGVSYSTRLKGYVGMITKNQRHYQVGVYSNVDMAAHAYNCTAVRLHGQFARLNPVGSDPRESTKGQVEIPVMRASPMLSAIKAKINVSYCD